MKKLIFILIVGIFYIGCATQDINGGKSKTPEKEVLKKEQGDCVEFISLLSAKEVAREWGWTEMKVLREYEVNLWEKPSSQGKGQTVGKMRAGSHARLFDRSGSDYYVQSPLDKSKGWVSDVQVSGIVMKNPKTFEYCN